MTTAEKLTAIADNSAHLYERGIEAERHDFWGKFQQNGARNDYQYAFYTSQWNDHTFRPCYDLRPVNANNMFFNCNITDLTALLQHNGIVLDTSSTTVLKQIFYWCYRLTAIPVIDTTAVASDENGLYGLFTNDSKLVTIERIILKQSGTQKFPIAFQGCSSLQEIRFDGVIGQDIDLSDSPLLSHDSLMSILAALKDYSAVGGNYSCALGTANLANLTDTEKVIATEKGWTLT